MSKKREAEFKPLLYTTTVRNPERIKFNLFVLKQYIGQILTNEIAIKIVGDLIKYGLYRPRKVTKRILNMWKQTPACEFAIKLLSDTEVLKIQSDNPQRHKEADFDKGYPSRFATIFDLAKEFGFIYYKIGEKIEFSELGNILADIVQVKLTDNNYIEFELKQPEREQSVFLQSLSRAQRANPFVRVLNDNIPLILLLNTIRLINLSGGKGISRREIPLLLFWKDNDAATLFSRIKKLREKYEYNPSDEVIIDICINEIMGGNFKKFKEESLMTDYTDEFIRKMRMSGLISLRGAGRFIDINHNEDKKVDYILEEYGDYARYDNEYDYFKYMSSIDKKLISIESEEITTEQTNDFLSEWVNIYDWETIKLELKNLSSKRASKDRIMKFLVAPVRLEFLVALAIKSKLPNIIVKPNYPCDDTGLPTSTAGGNKSDIECFEDDKGIIVEVTMAEGRTQTVMEIWPIERHLATFIKSNDIKAQAIFIAPSIYLDSSRQIDFVRYTNHLIIRDYSIEKLIIFLESTKELYIAQT